MMTFTRRNNLSISRLLSPPACWCVAKGRVGGKAGKALQTTPPTDAHFFGEIRKKPSRGAPDAAQSRNQHALSSVSSTIPSALPRFREGPLSERGAVVHSLFLAVIVRCVVSTEFGRVARLLCVTTCRSCQHKGQDHGCMLPHDNPSRTLCA